MNKVLKIALTIWLVVLCVSCTQSVDIAIADVDYLGWNASTPAKVIYTNQDTLSKRNILVMIRHSSSLKNTNLHLYIETISASHEYIIEELDVFIKGGSSSGFSELSIPYRTNVVLRDKGIYKFYISHNSKPVQGINSVGIIIK